MKEKPFAQNDEDKLKSEITSIVSYRRKVLKRLLIIGIICFISSAFIGYYRGLTIYSSIVGSLIVYTFFFGLAWLSSLPNRHDKHLRIDLKDRVKVCGTSRIARIRWRDDRIILEDGIKLWNRYDVPEQWKVGDLISYCVTKSGSFIFKSEKTRD